MVKSATIPDPLFLWRLRECAERAGSIRTLAERCEIGEAHMYRYLSGAIDIPLDRVRRVAVVSKVDLGWLVTGRGEPTGPLAHPSPTNKVLSRIR